MSQPEPEVTEDDLTPTEDLLMEAVAARHRCGEGFWTFGTRHIRTARTLAARGLVHWQRGDHRTIRVWLTDAGKAMYLSPTYNMPGAPDLTEHVAHVIAVAQNVPFAGAKQRRIATAVLDFLRAHRS